MTGSITAKQIIDRAAKMRTERQPFDAMRQQVRDYIIPEAQGITSRDQPGARGGEKIIDGTATYLHEKLQAFLVSTLTPDNALWAGVRAEYQDLNQDRENAQWFDDCAKRMGNIFRRTSVGFSSCQFQKYGDVASHGHGASFVAYSPGRGIKVVSVPIDELLVDEDPYGDVNTVLREYELTARQALEEWPEDCPEKIRKTANDPQSANKKFKFIHAVLPRHEYDPAKSDVKNLPFTSIEVSIDEECTITESGFHEMPYQVPRWYKRAGEKYGRGPGSKALADVKMLQRTKGITIISAEKEMDAPMMVVDDGVLGPVRNERGGLTYVRAGAFNQDPIRRLPSGGRPDIGYELITDIRQLLEDAFYKQLLQMVRRDRMTAYEVMQVQREANTIMGPYLTRLKSEDLGPMVERVFGIMLRMGAFMPMPEKLQGQRLEVEYISPDVKQLRISQAQNFSNYMQIAAPLEQLQPGTVKDNLDGDNVARDLADIMSLPKTWLTSEKDRDASRAAAQQENAKAIQQQQMLQEVDTAANVVRSLPALSEVMEGENA